MGVLAIALSLFTFGCSNFDGDSGSADPSNRAATIVVDKVNGPYTKIADGIAAASAGDTVLVKAGTYNESVSVSKSGSASGGYITILGEEGAIVNNSKSGNAFTIENKSYIKIDNIEITNCTQGVEVICSSNIYIQNCFMHAVGKDSNELVIYAHGTASSSTASSNIYILNNELSYNRTGNSEVCTMNGNVNGFTIQGNYIHHNDNIGIDCIGYEEENGPSGSNYARNGLVCDNVVDYISCEGGPGFARNPTYPTNDFSADAIYVDGGAYIVIERNKVTNSDIGIELASEHENQSTNHITIRDNFVSKSHQGNIQMGGSGETNGQAQYIYVYNNSTYQGGEAELKVQNASSYVYIKNNIFVAKSGLSYLLQDGSNNSNFTVNNNIYYGASTSSPGSWTDSAARYVNPLYVSTTDFHIQSTSPAINVGVSADYGTYDIDSTARVQGTAVDIGADEYNSGSVVTYTITASAGSGGTISPSGSVTVNQSANQTFSISANSGYSISSVSVDGTSVGAVATYTFSNVQAAHTISASFAAVPTYTITASAGTGGTISPSGSVSVTQGAGQTFTIAANSGYSISSVLVDGTSVGAVTTYSFSNVTASHTISASFAAVPTYTITATANSGGTISPSGSVSVTQGQSKTFTISANSGYSISSVLVDGTSVGAVATYTFSNVQAAHSITASFAAVPTYTITASAGTGGTISPSGSVSVTQGANQAFTIAANAGYTISSVTVDGTNVGAVSTYTFSNVTAAHTIAAAFTVSSSTFTIGYTTIGSSTDNGNANLLKAMKVTLSSSAVIQSLSLYTKTAGGKLTLGIYTDSSGSPGTLVATTASITPVAKSWNTTQTSTHPTLAAGTYWLVFETNNNTQTQSYVTSSVACKYRSFTYGTMPSSFGTATTDWKVNYSFYATFQ